jgi:L-ascorbate metabolism protein UlaG (beta-lactamase superfamily)
MDQALADNQTAPVAQGARIWKLYNHGFLVRTPSVTWTHDLVPGPPRIEGFRVSPELVGRLAAQSDATFISHLHNDHANEEVASAFLERGKPVLAPEGLWKDNPNFATKLTYPKRSTTELTRVRVQKGERTLDVVAYPGHQGAAILNNVHLVRSPGGFTTVQTGDQSNIGDFEWLAQIGAQHKIDVLLPNCWTTDIQRLARGANPRFILTGHENEMAHTVPHREDYTQTWTRLNGSAYPLLLMTWGESYTFA